MGGNRQARNLRLNVGGSAMSGIDERLAAPRHRDAGGHSIRRMAADDHTRVAGNHDGRRPRPGRTNRTSSTCRFRVACGKFGLWTSGLFEPAPLVLYDSTVRRVLAGESDEAAHASLESPADLQLTLHARVIAAVVGDHTGSFHDGARPTVRGKVQIKAAVDGRRRVSKDVLVYPLDCITHLKARRRRPELQVGDDDR